MQIEKNKVVTFHYRLNDADGPQIESSEGNEPMAYLHGHHGIIRGLEEAMAGKQPGDQFSVTLPPDKAYGPRYDNLQQRIPIKHLLSRSKKLHAGQVVSVNTKQGARDVTIIKVGKFNVDIDSNHPLAGKTLVFAIDIVDVRDATKEEIAHGHAHGAGGHQH